jgi:hypothetical protein
MRKIAVFILAAYRGFLHGGLTGHDNVEFDRESNEPPGATGFSQRISGTRIEDGSS